VAVATADDALHARASVSDSPTGARDVSLIVPINKSRQVQRIMYRPDRPFVTIITAINGLRLSPFPVGIWCRSSLRATAKILAVMAVSGQDTAAATCNSFDARNG
jgi:hypothetical protein